jgi:chromosomal replication initiation ATPase DnaA
VLVLTGERGSGKSYLVKQIQNRGLAKRYKVLFVPKTKGHVKQGSVVDQEIHRMTTVRASMHPPFTLD